ncbi:hypothetical protein [Roseateles microcysteis]|uniref:hypothetical protein n=1 Tax=Roseateles microcysteis TaxID=3119057 RepID=UPI002FE57579
MAKLSAAPVGPSELLEYLNSVSDFSFELSVLKMLRTLGVDCEHGGHYEDPVTGKSREFDIRAEKTIDRRRVRMAVECKNIRENFPILISCVPRHAQEAYHQIVFTSREKPSDSLYVPGLDKPRASSHSLRGAWTLYPEGQPVGKSTAQVGRAGDGTITCNDSELYEKWGQCLSSMVELVENAYWDGSDDDYGTHFMSAAFPFVVVPNGRLWMVTYDADGNRTSEPTPAIRVSCFIDRLYEMRSKVAKAYVRLSHLDVVTVDGLRAFVENNLSSEQAMEKIFSMDGIRAGQEVR